MVKVKKKSSSIKDADLDTKIKAVMEMKLFSASLGTL